MTQQGDQVGPDHGEDDDPTMRLLAGHVPLTLLVDLVEAPTSEQVLREEGLPEQAWWEPSAPVVDRD